MAKEDDRQHTNNLERKCIEELTNELLAIALRQGFYGKIYVEANIQNGVIQGSDGIILPKVKRKGRGAIFRLM